MCENISRSVKKFVVIATIKTFWEFPWEERGHGHSQNITYVILAEDQGSINIFAYYRIGSKCKKHFVRSKTTMISRKVSKLQWD